MKIVGQINRYEKISEEDILKLENASLNESDKAKKFIYNKAAESYRNKDSKLKELIDNATDKLSQGIIIVSDTLNGIISLVLDKKRIPKTVSR